MRTFKIVIFSALVVYHIATIIIISIGRNNFDFLLNLFNKLDLMMYGAYLGLALFLVVVLFDQLNKNKLKTVEKKHQDEINLLKAKLYDKKEVEQTVPKESTIVSEEPSSENTHIEDSSKE